MASTKSFFYRLNLLVRKCGKGLKYSRLAGTLAAFELALDRRIMTKGGAKEPWMDQSRDLLDRSKDFLKEYKIDEAWKCFHGAQRLEVYGMSPEERKSIARELKQEASKLKEWRQKAVLELIDDKVVDMNKPEFADVLYRALSIKDEHNDNMYYINSVTRRLFLTLFILLVFNILGIILYLAVGMQRCHLDFTKEIPLIYNIYGVLLFGVLGAITSTIIGTRNQAKLSRISELGSDWLIAVSKILVAAGFAVFIFFLLNSNMALKIEIFSFEIDTPSDYFIIAFICGFSERFAQKAIDTLIGKDDKSGGKSNGPMPSVTVVNTPAAVGISPVATFMSPKSGGASATNSPEPASAAPKKDAKKKT